MTGNAVSRQKITAGRPALVGQCEAAMFTFVQHDGAVKRRKLV